MLSEINMLTINFVLSTSVCNTHVQHLAKNKVISLDSLPVAIVLH